MPVFTQQAGYIFSLIMTDVTWESLKLKSPIKKKAQTEILDLEVFVIPDQVHL